MARKSIALLHAAQSNVGVFDAASANLNVASAHHVRADLLVAAEAAGGLTGAVVEATAAALREQATLSDAVVLTCSTLGPAISLAAAPVLRADTAVARSLKVGRATLYRALAAFKSWTPP